MRHAVNGTQPGDRDVLITLARKLRQVRDEDLAAMDVAAAGVALDIFEQRLLLVLLPVLVPELLPVLADELDRLGYIRRSGDTIVRRLRTPPVPFVGSAVLGGMLAGLLVALLLLAVYQWWT